MNLADDFSTDPFGVPPRWTNEVGVAVWDSVNAEIDAAQSASNCGLRYSAADPGSLEHEAQVTFLNDAAFPGSAGYENGGPAIRARGDGANDWYGTYLNTLDNLIAIVRIVAGGRTVIATAPLTVADLQWWTLRLAAQGAAGSNVTLALWWLDHGVGAKPADPGWIGSDVSPDFIFVDGQIARLDEADNTDVGIANAGTGIAVDTRHSYWRARALTDRSVDVSSGSWPYMPGRGPTKTFDPRTQSPFHFPVVYRRL